MPKRKSISRDQYIMLGLAVLCVLLTGKIISDAIVKHELVADHRAKSLEIHATYIKLDSIQQIVDSKIATITRLGGENRHALEDPTELAAGKRAASDP